MIVDGVNLDEFIHGQNLYRKTSATKDTKLLVAFGEYKQFRRNISKIKVLDKQNIEKFLQFFNDYRAKVVYIFEERPNSGQENLRTSMLEEFLTHLFSDLIIKICGIKPVNLYLGKGKGYVDLTFSPKSFSSMFSNPNPYFHSKDQDVLLGAKFVVSISPSAGVPAEGHKEDIVVPIFAIECKTYLERNMLDSCAGTASRLKKAMPYCLYLVASEYIKMEAAQPELTDISEVFVLCKASNAERLERSRVGKPVHPIDNELVIELFEMVHRHLNSIWWKPEDVLKFGKVINRPL
ncbi:hypothetical protein ES703_45244 [subsurface metagenome]